MKKRTKLKQKDIIKLLQFIPRIPVDLKLNLTDGPQDYLDTSIALMSLTDYLRDINNTINRNNYLRFGDPHEYN